MRIEIFNGVIRKDLTEEDRAFLINIANTILNIPNNRTTELQHRWFAIKQGLIRDKDKETTRIFSGTRKSKRRRNRKTRRRKN